MECTFVVGQKVTPASDIKHYPGVIIPKMGETYTIREVFSCFEGIGIRLAEIRNGLGPTLHDGIAEPGFRYQFFRPVTDLLEEFMVKRKRKLKTPERELQC
jgi:hypothetical protein